MAGIQAEFWKDPFAEDPRAAFLAFPISLMPDQVRVLVELLGHESAYNLIDKRGGGQMYIPKLDQLNRMSRNAHIVQLRGEGISSEEISRRLGLTSQQVYEILSKARKAQSVKTTA